MSRLVAYFLFVPVGLSLLISACASPDEVTREGANLPSAGTATSTLEAEPSRAPSSSPFPLFTSVAASEPTAAPTEPSTPTNTPAPTATPTPTATPVLLQLTQGECCTQPFWAPDSTAVLYIDRPDPTLPAGIWGVSIDNPLEPFLFTDRIALYSDDLRYLVDSDGQTTTIERLPDAAANDPGDRWQVPAGGGPVSFSPGRTRIAWQESNNALAVETRVTDIWIANLDGAEPRSAASLPRGGLVGWIAEDLLLVSGRESLSSSETVVWSYDISTGAMVELVRGERIRGTTLSPDGSWLVYYETFGDPADNGLWVAKTDGSERFPLPRDLFGAYQWRDSQRLLIVPFEPAAQYHVLWQYDVQSRTARQLTPPTTPFKIANGDWRVSPDGASVVFVESSDRNLWLLTLGD